MYRYTPRDKEKGIIYGTYINMDVIFECELQTAQCTCIRMVAATLLFIWWLPCYKLNWCAETCRWEYIYKVARYHGGNALTIKPSTIRHCCMLR